MLKSLSESPIQFVKGVGPAKAKLLENLGVFTVEDLLYLFPNRYEDRSQLTPIAMLQPGYAQVVIGTIIAAPRRNFFSRTQAVEISIEDKSGRLFCVWFNQPYLAKTFKEGQEIAVYGRIEVFKKRLQMMSPVFELIGIDDRGLNMGRIVPIYPLTKGISQKYLRKLIDHCLSEYSTALEDILPDSIRIKYHLIYLRDCIRNIHFPDNLQQQQEGINRIAFEEFFLFQISVILRRLSIVSKQGITHRIDEDLKKLYAQSFPFALTNAQNKVIEEIIKDMSLPKPMLRLLQGDVGCGKTVVAFFGCLVAFKNKGQSAVMAPTELLAQQHFANFQKYLGAGHFKNLKAGLLISGLAKKEKDAIYKQLHNGELDVVFGTHALLEETVKFKRLNFVVIDEQHKFGVKQRALLTSKGSNPDVLIMTATPIPRTLCLTLYGDLEVSVINELPPGRGSIHTYHFPTEKSSGVYEKVRQWVKKGTQAYIVYPMIEESEKLDLKNATEMYERFCQLEFKGLRVALVHGRMDRKEVNEIMIKFKNHELDILVSTTVLEVGIDVANANVMVIEHAERFGLSQLHQLRGRIGRGQKDAVCILLGDCVTEESKQRIEAIVKTTDGFKIAEYDLQIRGPGHYFGGNQHGLNELRVANPVTHIDLLEKARHEASVITQKDPRLLTPGHERIKKIIQKRYPQYLELVFAG